MGKLPNVVAEQIWSAVEGAVNDGASPRDFVYEVRTAWAEAIRSKGAMDDAFLRQAVEHSDV